ncbi:phosphotransferase [Methyloligella sp. 2.7D]|uniref:phosphotransferase n=1 Tax=unclassified Methyloligella TaxID=2625955 RepID=UPI00157CD45F|nr:phosphotransferase [Methyloligella sp. GL2]QKP76685.1 phosphotransferase [Methyloligella sp. GL2]
MSGVRSELEARIAALGFWDGPVTLQSLSGGITNHNFLVDCAGRKFVARAGDDIPEHQVMRFNELTASRAAAAAGLSPAVVHAEPGILILDYIDAPALGPEQVRAPEMVKRILPLIRRCHREVPNCLRGPVVMFWVFHVLRDYTGRLLEEGSRHAARLPELQAEAALLEEAVGPIEVVFGHNDLLAANFLDAGDRLWLIDWDYAGFNSPLFDLGGLASNNEFSEAAEREMLESYFETPLTDALWRRYAAMKCASLLRETQWSMISEIHSEVDFDYAAYTAENLARYERAFADFKTL